MRPLLAGVFLLFTYLQDVAVRCAEGLVQCFPKLNAQIQSPISIKA